MSSQHTEGTGLRARKRAETERRIVEIASDLVKEHGYDHVTIEMICTESSVSQGTFFNYFGTKEGVFLGSEQLMPSTASEDVFVRGDGSVLRELHALVAAPFLTMLGHDRELMMIRRVVIDQVPALAGLEMARFTEVEEHFTRLVLRRFAAQGREEPEQILLDEARTVVNLGIVVGRRVMAHWSDGGDIPSIDDLAEREIEAIHRLSAPTLPR